MMCWRPGPSCARAPRLSTPAPWPVPATTNGRATVRPVEMGLHELVVQAWTDRYATWAHRAAVKFAARQDVHNEIAEAVALLSEWWAPDGEVHADGPVVQALAALRDESLEDAARINRALSAPVAEALAGEKFATDLTIAAPGPIWVDRPVAACRGLVRAVPPQLRRSAGGGRPGPPPGRAGLRRPLPSPRPPDRPHVPKGQRQFAHGRAGRGPGSPWAIGSEQGGSTPLWTPTWALLRTSSSWCRRRRSRHGGGHGLRAQLLARPPWVKEHPEWFHHRPDGSIAYAENPPRSTRTSIPLNFWPRSEEADRVALWEACKGDNRFLGLTGASGFTGWTTRTPSRSPFGNGW